MRRSSLVLLAIIVTAPFLQGAGCTAWFTSVRGSVELPADPPAAWEGRPVVLLFVDERAAGDGECIEMWGSCPEIRAEHQLTGATPVRVERGRTSYEFWVDIPYNVSVTYRADVGAFVDLDEDGLFDAGEPFGWYSANPVQRTDEISPCVPDREHTSCSVVTIDIAP